jgi:hypothetical protein
VPIGRCGVFGPSIDIATVTNWRDVEIIDTEMAMRRKLHKKGKEIFAPG